MRRLVLIVGAVLLLLAPRVPTFADGETGPISQFEVSLFSQRERKDIPLIRWDDGKFTMDRRARLTRGSMLHVKVKAISGKYLSICFRDTYGNIYDLPMDQRKMNHDTKEILFRMPGRFSPGEVEFFVCLWESYDPEQNKNDGQIQRSGWITVGEYSI